MSKRGFGSGFDTPPTLTLTAGRYQKQLLTYQATSILARVMTSPAIRCSKSTKQILHRDLQVVRAVRCSCGCNR